MQIGWIDFSRDERNRIIKALSLLDQPGAVDELGIGVIRDAYSDILFPGISTLQTRAKYFVLIPYIFARAEKQQFDSADAVLPWVEKHEDALADILIRNSKDTDTSGIHGLRSQNHIVKQKPSAIYWGGLRAFGIVRSATMSLSEACRIVYQKSRQLAKASPLRKEDSGFDDPAAYTDNDILFAPLAPNYKFPDQAAIRLTGKEARFLRQQITNARAVRGSLLEYMLRTKTTWPAFDKISPTKLPSHLARPVSLARQFAEFIHGAHLRYNVLYSGLNDGEYAKRYAKWAKDFSFSALDLEAILANVPRKNPATIRFLYDFAKAAASGKIDRVNTLIVEREREVKPGGRAKIGKPKEYPYTTPVHNHKLVYRYNTARGIVGEILDALNKEEK